MPDSSRIIARSFSRVQNLGILAAIAVGAAPRQAPREPNAKPGVGGGSCDMTWVQTLLSQAGDVSCQERPGADLLTFPAALAVGIGASGTVQVIVQRSGFLGYQLTVPDSVAAAFTIDDVRVAGRSIMTAQNPISGELLSSKSEECYMFKWPKAGAGVTIAVDYTNVSNAAASLRLALSGVSWG